MAVANWGGKDVHDAGMRAENRLSMHQRSLSAVWKSAGWGWAPVVMAAIIDRHRKPESSLAPAGASVADRPAARDRGRLRKV